MKKFDRTALSLIILCLLVLSGVVLFGSRQPMRITYENKNLNEVSPRGNISFIFSRPVDQAKAAALWQIEPSTTGRWQWKDERHATWYATTPLSTTQSYQMSFKAGEIGTNGEKLEADQSWQIRVRQPIILALQKESNGGNELYRIALDGKTEPRQLSQTNGKIIDYSSSRDGEYFIMSISNDKNGADFWISNRDGSHQHKLLDCGSDRCTTAVWSPVSNEIAYTRESAGLDPNGAKGAPRVWILDVESGESAPLFSDSQKIGYGPVWSPDGKYLSIWNGIDGGVQVVERKTGAITLLQTQSGDTGCWSPDGSALYYTNLIIGQSSFHNVILKADMLQGTIQTVLGSNLEGEGLNYDLPACHPSRNLVAASVQPNARIPGKNLVIFNMDTNESTTVTTDLTRFPTFYSWDAGGNYLLYQMSGVSNDTDDIEIWVWDNTAHSARLITTGFWSPAWLP